MTLKGADPCGRSVAVMPGTGIALSPETLQRCYRAPLLSTATRNSTGSAVRLWNSC